MNFFKKKKKTTVKDYKHRIEKGKLQLNQIINLNFLL